MKTISKILSIVLCLAMVVGFFVVGAAAESVTGTLVTDAATLKQGGSYVVVAKYNDTYYAMSANVASKPTATAISAPSNNQITGDLPVWTVASCGNGISLAVGSAYLAYNSSTNFKSDTSAYEFTLTANSDGSFEVFCASTAGANTERALAFQDNTANTAGSYRFAPYGTNQTTDNYSFGIFFYKVGDAGSTGSGNTGSGNTGSGNTGSGNTGSGSSTTPSTIGAVRTEATTDKSYTVTGVITYIKSDNKTVYVQDATGAICLYFSSAQTGLEQGKVITATGTYKEYNGLPELTGMSEYTTATDSSLTLASVIKTITMSQLSANICAYVKISNLSVVIDSGKTYLSDGTNQAQWYTPVAATTPANGDTVSEFKGVVGIFNNPQLLNTVATEVTLTPASGNTGSGNTGSGNTGNEGNTGSGNTGSGNTGSGNTGSGSTGTTSGTYTKVTDTLVSGTYVLVANNGYAPTTFASGWMNSVQPTVSGEKVTDAKGAVLTLTVNGSKVTITDSEGNVIINETGANKLANTAGATWNWKYENGAFVFFDDNTEEGQTRYLCSAKADDNKRFRAYRGPFDEPDNYGNLYYNQFTAYKLDGSSSDSGNTGSGNTGSGNTGSGSTQKPAAPFVPDTGVKEPTVGSSFKFGMYQETLKTYLYFNGKLDSKGYYLDSTDKYTEAVDVTVEAATGGYYLYFMNGSTKTYIDIYVTDNGYVNLRLVETPSAVYAWNAENKTFTTKLTVNNEELDYFISTYKEYTTFSAGKLSYISTSYAAHLYASEPAPTADNSMISVAVAAAVLSFMGATILVMKKKEF